jgi:integrase
MRRSRVRSRLYRRPDSPFIWAEFTPADGGAPVRQSTGCRDDDSARAWLATRELERVRADAGVPAARPQTLLRATAEYLTIRKPEWSDGWYATVEGFIANSIIPRLGGDRLVSSISRADVEAFRATEIGRPKRLTRCCKAAWTRAAEGWACAVCLTPAPEGAPVIGDATVNRLLAAMAAFGAWCLVEGRAYHTTNPWAKHAPLAEDQVPVPELEGEQLERVLRALDGPDGPLPSHGAREFRFPWRALVEFARETGLRKGELGRLRREDIRKADRVAFITSTKKRGRTKSRKMRPVVLSTRALELLDQVPHRLDGLVFGPVPDARRAFATAAKAAGLQRVWLHLFRHLFASRLAERGAGRHELTEAGGWSSGRMADRYTHARLERLRALVEGEQPKGPRRAARRK